jgi:hypothetical protein
MSSPSFSSLWLEVQSVIWSSPSSSQWKVLWLTITTLMSLGLTPYFLFEGALVAIEYQHSKLQILLDLWLPQRSKNNHMRALNFIQCLGITILLHFARKRECQTWASGIGVLLGKLSTLLIWPFWPKLNRLSIPRMLSDLLRLPRLLTLANPLLLTWS